MVLDPTRSDEIGQVIISPEIADRERIVKEAIKSLTPDAPPRFVSPPEIPKKLA
jgi:hypothetical protein